MLVGNRRLVIGSCTRYLWNLANCALVYITVHYNNRLNLPEMPTIELFAHPLSETFHDLHDWVSTISPVERDETDDFVCGHLRPVVPWFWLHWRLAHCFQFCVPQHLGLGLVLQVWVVNWTASQGSHR